MSPQIRYDGQVVVVTGAGAGLGKAYALFYAARGAKVVVNDLGGSFNGLNPEKTSGKVADLVVDEIRKAGGVAVANYDAVQNGERVIETAMKEFGRVDVVINNAGILRDVSFKNMKPSDWDAIIEVHFFGSVKVLRAAWPIFRKQKYGRVINTTSASGLFGAFGQSNYAAAKMALVGLTHTLAKEGKKYNIHVNALAPSAGSRLTSTVWPPEMVEAMKPDWIVPLVGVLTHSSSTETGSIFEAGAGHFSKIRYERSQGAVLRPDETLTPEAVLQNHDKIIDFTNPEHPTESLLDMSMLEKAWRQPPSKTSGAKVDFRGRVALITGAGAGLGRAYALLFGKLGAKVAVNDIKDAKKVAEEIKSAGGEAIAIPMSVEQGDAVVKAVTDTYGRIDILVNNAGILHDKAFHNQDIDGGFRKVVDVHLNSAFRITKAAWPWFLKQKYGRVVNITSTSGIYGNFGQSPYSSAKLGLVGFGKSLSREGQKYNIIVNTIAPTAGTNMTRTIMPEDQVQALRPEYVAPLVAALCSEKPPATGRLYEAGVGWFASTRWQRTRGVDFAYDQGVPEAEKVAEAFDRIIRFDQQADNPEHPQDGGRWYMANALKSPAVAKAMDQQENSNNRRYLSKIHAATGKDSEAVTYSYSDRDVILYNLGVGAKRTDLPLVFEGDDNFQALPTFGIVPTYFNKSPYDLKTLLPNFDMRKLLHGEQYLEIKKFPIPTAGSLKVTSRLIEVVDKGNAALVRRSSTAVDSSGSPVFYNESVSFIREAGNFGGAKKPSDRGPATAPNDPPSRSADKIVEEKTSEDLAALYRLMGDYNPLHIDPSFSRVGGFETPILHGLATFGITGKHVFQSFGPFRNIKVRFSGVVLPGQTIVTEMWREGGKVIFRAKVKETGKSCISNAAVELMGDSRGKL